MIDKKSTGEIKLVDGEEIVMPNVDGEIVKIRVYNTPGNSPDLHVKIVTADGEVMVNREIGDANCIFYPKNNDALHGYVDLESSDRVTVTPDVAHPERYFNDGIIKIIFTNSNDGNVIEDIVITVIQ